MLLKAGCIAKMCTHTILFVQSNHSDTQVCTFLETRIKYSTTSHNVIHICNNQSNSLSIFNLHEH